MTDILLSLGSNIELKDIHLKRAVEELNRSFSLIKLSSLYESEPLEDQNQDNFINLVALYKTDINDPNRILDITQAIEAKLGRIKDPSRPKGPRVIDIDIIFIADLTFETERLCIPHKSFLNRKFVLEPLIEILPKESFYYKKYKLNQYLKELKGQKIKKIGALIL